MANVKQTVKGFDVVTGYVMVGTVCYRYWKIFSKILALCFLLYFLCLFSGLNPYNDKYFYMRSFPLYFLSMLSYGFLRITSALLIVQHMVQEKCFVSSF